MKILWFSNSPHAPTGYGQQTGLFVPRLVEAGYDVAIASNYGHQGGVADWHGIKVLPTGMVAHSCDILPSHAADWLGGEPGDGWIFTLYDLWPLRNPRLERFNIASWCPVDHRPVPPEVREFLMAYNSVPVAMSQFGVDQLTKAGFEPLYIPHGIDTTMLTPGDQMKSRELLNIPTDAFVVTMNGANKGQVVVRKSFADAFAAFSLFLRARPDAFLYLHTEALGLGGGVNLAIEVADAGIPPDRVVFTDQYGYRLGLDQTFLTHLYRAADVLLAPSMGEGFGIPVIEAQSCGTRVIVSDFSAQPELVGDGWMVAGEPFRDYGQRAWLFKPSIDSIFVALMEAYETKGSGPSDKAREHAENYDVDRVLVEHFLPVLRTLEARTPTLEPIGS